MAAFDDEDVGGLDVAVDDALRVRRAERLGNLDRQVNHRLGLQAFRREQCGEGLPFQRLHDDEVPAIVLVDVVDGADMWMIESGGGSRLAPESLERNRIARDFLRQKLESNGTAEACVFCLVDHSHAAAAKFGHDAVPGNHAAIHLMCGGIYQNRGSPCVQPGCRRRGYLALKLNAPELCDKVSPDAVEHGPVFGNSAMRIRYLQSLCFYDLAALRGDDSLCRRVRTISTPWRDGSGLTEDTCRGHVRRGRQHTGGNYGTNLVLGVMGYSDDDIRKRHPDHPAPDRSFQFVPSMTPGDARTIQFRARLQRLPDFSLGDAVAIRQLYTVVPACADRKSKSYECRRIRCALVRAQAGDLGCERGLERERSPWE